MPERPPPPPKDLDEVERALSVLGGRHPEHERTRRETLAAAETRRHELETELAASSRRRRRRTIIIGVNLVALVAAGVVGWRVMTRAKGLRGGLSRAEAAFVAQGMAEVTSNELSGRETLTFDAPGSTCFVAVADGEVEASEGTMSARADGSIGWCSCDAGRVTLSGPEGRGLALMQIDARRVGGPLARSWTTLRPTTWGDPGGECADAMLDAWIADGGGRGGPLDPGWLTSTPGRASLEQAGFHVVGTVDPGHPFGVVSSAAGDCVVAIAEGADDLSLRATGGQQRVAHVRGGMAWCSSSAETTSVGREGRSRVVVLAVPAARVGGLLGARECAEVAGTTIVPGATWLRNEDLAWDATSLLRGSGLTEAKTADVPVEPGPPTPDIVALSRAPGASVAADPQGVTVACDPPLDDAAERTLVCAGSAPVSWWRHGDASAAMAYAPIPFWLSLLQSHREPDAVARIPELLALARRLLRDGFEPTVLEGVTELPDGVRVVGRAHEDAIVAVGLVPRPPWAIPYSDATPWDLGDKPRVVPLEPGLAVKLVASPPPDAPPEKRRTVVFRHAKRP